MQLKTVEICIASWNYCVLLTVKFQYFRCIQKHNNYYNFNRAHLCLGFANVQLMQFARAKLVIWVLSLFVPGRNQSCSILFPHHTIFCFAIPHRAALKKKVQFEFYKITHHWLNVRQHVRRTTRPFRQLDSSDNSTVRTTRLWDNSTDGLALHKDSVYFLFRSPPCPRWVLLTCLIRAREM